MKPILLLLFLTPGFNQPALPLTAEDSPGTRAKDDSLYAKGLQALQDGRVHQALGLLNAIEDSTRPSVHQLLASVYSALGEADQAEKQLGWAIGLDSSMLRCRMQLAELLDRQGRFDEAESWYRSVVAKDTSHIAAREALGSIAMKKRQFELATEEYGRAIALAPRSGSLHALLGTALLRAGNIDSARMVFAVALTLDKRNVPVMIQLGTLHFEKKAFDDALRLFIRAAQLQPWNSDAWYRAGLCNERLGYPELAVDHYRKSLAADSGNIYALQHLGSAWYQMKRYDSSVVAYTRAAAIATDDAVIYTNLGVSYGSLDSTNRAITCFERAATVMDPERFAGVYERIGGQYLHVKKFKEAGKNYRRALDFAPARTSAMFYAGLCADHLKKYQEAGKYYAAYLKGAKGEEEKERIAAAKKRLAVFRKTGIR